MSIEKLKEAVKKILPEVDVVIGYRQGFDPLHATPYFISQPEQIDQLIWNPLCVQNLCSYLPFLKGKVGVIVKGCDSRTIVQYMQEKLIEREKIKVIGVPCLRVISVKKVMAKIDYQVVEEVAFEGENIIVKTPKETKTIPLAEVMPRKCLTCQLATPLQYDILAGEAIQANKPAEAFEEIKEFEQLPLEERRSYWEREFDRCIRCYACRNACPMCICQDRCIAESRDPHWTSQRANLTEKFMFHMIHSVHLAGRCIGCGECERVCPMDIPVAKIKKKISMDLKELFDYQAGINPDDLPPMYTFKVEEANIKEHEL